MPKNYPLVINAELSEKTKKNVANPHKIMISACIGVHPLPPKIKTSILKLPKDLHYSTYN